MLENVTHEFWATNPYLTSLTPWCQLLATKYTKMIHNACSHTTSAAIWHAAQISTNDRIEIVWVAVILFFFSLTSNDSNLKRNSVIKTMVLKTMNTLFFSQSNMYFHSFDFAFILHYSLVIILNELFLSLILPVAERFDGKKSVWMFNVAVIRSRVFMILLVSRKYHIFVCVYIISFSVRLLRYFLFLTSGFLNWLNYQIVLHLIIFPYILHALHSYINGMSVPRSLLGFLISLTLSCASSLR